ncbi:hypothetical protein OH77DRAFT_1263302 [Trametes cingulata]|nr:hypothetical protein OH77DRAFT_1263302 [Trametes cingulata]
MAATGGAPVPGGDEARRDHKRKNPPSGPSMSNEGRSFPYGDGSSSHTDGSRASAPEPAYPGRFSQGMP